MKKIFFGSLFMLSLLSANASCAFFIHFRIPDYCMKDIGQVYFELANNGDTILTEMVMVKHDKATMGGHVFSLTAESRIRKGKMEFLMRFSKNGKKWVTDKMEVDITAKEAEIHFYHSFGNQTGKTGIEDRTVYRIMRGDDKGKMLWKKSLDGKDSAIHYVNLTDTTVYAIGHPDAPYGEMFRRNESNLFAVEWKGVNADNPCHNQKILKEIEKGDTVKMTFPNLQCNELKVSTVGKYQARIYVTTASKPSCTKQGEETQVCILDAKEYLLQFDKK